MKNLIIVTFLFISTYVLFESKQQKAEHTVKDYIHLNNPKANLDSIRFTALDTIKNVIAVLKMKMIHDNQNRPVFIGLLYYQLNKDLTKIEAVYTN
ncbi:hypothetical protein [Mucilaginibacter sp.]